MEIPQIELWNSLFMVTQKWSTCMKHSSWVCEIIAVASLARESFNTSTNPISEAHDEMMPCIHNDAQFFPQELGQTHNYTHNEILRWTKTSVPNGTKALSWSKIYAPSASGHLDANAWRQELFLQLGVIWAWALRMKYCNYLWGLNK